jgi:hypothetical protein
MSENASGESVEVQKAFTRVAKTGDNRENSTNMTEMKKVYGDDAEVGQIIAEHPTLGTDLRVRFGRKDLGNKWDEYDSDYPTHFLYGSLYMSYNLAPIVNISQVYLDVMFDYSMDEDDIDGEGSDSFTGVSLGLGVHKKINVNRINIPVGLMYEYQLYGLEEDGFTASYRSHAVELNLGVQYMINQDIMVHIGYHMDLFNNLASYEDSDGSTDEIPDVIKNVFKTSHLGFGIDYTLTEFPINIFGFLDPYKKH